MVAQFPALRKITNTSANIPDLTCERGRRKDEVDLLGSGTKIGGQCRNEVLGSRREAKMVAVTEVKVAFDDGFWPSVEALDAVHNRRVVEALNKFTREPDHPNLKLKSLKGDLDGLWSIRARRDVRVVMERRGDTFVWLFAGMRRDVYERAERGRFLANARTGFMGFVDAPDPASAVEPERRQPRKVSAPGIFDHWSTPELLSAGLSEAEVDLVRPVTDERELLELDVPYERLDLLIKIMANTPESMATGKDSEAAFRELLERFGAAAGISRLFTAEEIERLLSAPIEDWMVFLHPDQMDVVRASHAGPARVRGAAGTGKTVVALHRAAELANRYPDERVLFVAYSETLVPALENLFARVPHADTSRVDFASIDSLARLVVGNDAGPAPTKAELESSFDTALAQTVTSSSPVARLSSDYLRAEVSFVIRGRGFSTELEYLEASRRGRRVGLTESMRREVWALHEAWVDVLGPERLEPHHLVLRASELAAGEPPRWRCAVVDEAQDLTMAGLDLVRSLISGGGREQADGLLLCGDGAQKVRPGGYTLRQAGVEVRGRTTILRHNYRSTAQIVEAAIAVAGAEEVVDLDEEFRRGELLPESDRVGAKPRLVVCDSEADEAQVIDALVDEIAAAESIGPGDIAVLAPSTSAEELADRLAQLRSTQPLLDYDGTPSSAVKTGEWSQAKGLEFKAVIVAGCGDATFPSPGPSDEHTDELSERKALELSHLFVAMTRARDFLTLVAVDPVAPEVKSAVDEHGAVEV